LSLPGSKSKKIIFIATGIICVAIAVIGIFLPLLPTTPLLLLASYFFIRSSHRFYKALINNKILGFYIKSYIEKKGIILKLKIINISLLWLFIGYTIIFVTEHTGLRILLCIIALSVSLHIILIKTLRK